MAFSLNKICLLGNLGKDAETRFTTSNVGVTSFSIATTHSFKQKDGNYANETTWHNCVIFNCNDFLRNALKKGQKVYLEGRLANESYEKDGQTKYITKVYVNPLSVIPLEKVEGGNEQPNLPPELNNLEEVEKLPF